MSPPSAEVPRNRAEMGPAFTTSWLFSLVMTASVLTPPTRADAPPVSVSGTVMGGRVDVVVVGGGTEVEVVVVGVTGWVIADDAVVGWAGLRDATVVVVVPAACGTTGAVVTGACAGAIVVVTAGTVVVVEVVAEAVEIVTVLAVVTSAGPVLELPSTTEFWAMFAMTVPSEVQVTETVIDEEVEAADGEKVQPDAVPRFWKSPALMPLTDSENVSV